MPELVSDYRRRLWQLWQQVWHRPQGLDKEQPVKLSTGVSTVLPSVIHATQFVLLLLPFGMTMVGGAILLLTRAPAATSERAAAEYGAAFFFSLAVTAFKNGIVGQRKPDRSVTPSMDWLGRSLQEGAGAFGLVLLLAAASTYFVMVILPAVPATIAGLLLLSAAGKPPRRRRRRRW